MKASRQFVEIQAPVTLATAAISSPEPDAQPVAMSGCGWAAVILGVLVLLGVAAAVWFSSARDMIPPDIGPDWGMQPGTGPADAMNAEVARMQAAQLGQAVEMFTLRVGELPRSLDELVAGPAGWDGEWESLLAGDVPMDPWGNTYEYRILDDATNMFLITSYGRDGLPGGGGADADIFWPEE